jgi:hypothetical protein
MKSQSSSRKYAPVIYSASRRTSSGGTRLFGLLAALFAAGACADVQPESDLSESAHIEAHVQAPLCRDCRAVDVAGDVVYVAEARGGPPVVSKARLPDLTLLGSLRQDRLTAQFEDASVANGLLAVADRNFGLRLYDVSPAFPAPMPLGTWQPSSSAVGGTCAVAIRGSTAYLSQNNMVRVIDISDRRAPRFHSNVGGVSAAYDLEVVGDRLFVAGNGLTIVDISTPSLPISIAQYSAGCPSAYDVAVGGRLLVLACGSAFHFIDVTDPRNPRARSTWPARGGMASAVAAVGRRAYLADALGVMSLDASDLRAPFLLGERPLQGVHELVAPYEGRIVAGTRTNGIYQWNL